MHLQQTKRGSRESGGPQYYFHNLTKEVRTYLRHERSVPVALMTPYGVTRSHFAALSKDAKLEDGRVVAGKVGHDRIQQGKAGESIGEAIRKWFALPSGYDFERIDVEIEIRDEKLYVVPVGYKLVGKARMVELRRPIQPLSFNRDFQSQLWRRQFKAIEEKNRAHLLWAMKEIRRIASAYEKPGIPNVLEPDLLRASGPLSVLGLQLGPYVGKGYDCRSVCRFLNYMPYEVPVEIKKRSSGFKYQQQKYGKEELSRALILCVEHDLTNTPPNIDVLELSYLASVGIQ